MTDNTASPYTVPLGWDDVQEGMTVELRHADYLAVAGKVEHVFPYPALIMHNAWYYESRDWSLWVKPEPVEPDPLVDLLMDFLGVKDADKAAEVIRAAGYMTKAEWNAKRAEGNAELIRRLKHQIGNPVNLTRDLVMVDAIHALSSTPEEATQ